MNVSCQECRTVYRVDPAKVAAGVVRARCEVCGAVIPVAVGVAGPQPTVAVDPLVDEMSARRTGGPDASVDRGSDRPAEGVLPDPGAASPVISSRLEPDAGERDATAYSPVAPSAAAPRLTASAPAAARPVNPYLSNTPELRARRLARALVSDLVAYHPQKREEGLRDGTLKQLFRDEIRKSWDEYVEQVGAHVAESTPHFQDALNDVLAGGRRMF